MNEKYREYQARLQKLGDLSSAIGLMHWDTEVYMPKGASPMRSRQIATLSGMAHEMFVDKDFGNLLDDLRNGNDLHPEQQRNIELSHRDYHKEIKLSTSFVEKLSRTVSAAFQAWEAAKQEDAFAQFAPHLEKLVELRMEEAEIRGYSKHPYDAMLDLYEPGLEVDFLDKTFQEAKDGIRQILQQLDLSIDTGRDAVFHQHFAKDKQWEFGLDVLRGIGYDFNHGRQDISSHPFSIGFSPLDVRVTTRVDEMDFANMCWSCIHEGGHALYEQGLPVDGYALPSGTAVSLSIHESQSRLWENHVGRGMAFWNHWYPKLQAYFPEQLAKVSLEDFYRAINTLRPNLIRTEADELHYHLHVIIRYEIERDLFAGSIKASELREVWNDKYASYLGLRPPDDRQGILQDVHWSHGSFGYFPTYSLGSFYAAQFFASAQEEISDLDQQISLGDCSELLGWLRKNIHAHGRMKDPADLCREVTGEELNMQHFLNYCSTKFKAIYVPE